MKLLVPIILLILSLSAFSNEIENSIVKIYVIGSSYDYYEPWKLESQTQASGSGFIIKGNQIVTNAHVVADSKFIQVKKASDSKKYTATVKVVSHDCDLAILSIDDSNFFKNSKPLTFADSIKTREKVEVYGFPIGGEKLSITEGVISRIEQRKYVHSGATLLACQIDAAINHGNSGGPAIKGDLVVGVAFQSAGQGQNLGYIIPISIVNHFLKDISDGITNSFPDLPITISTMESTSLKEYFNYGIDKSGVLVRFVDPTSSTSRYIKTNDIITNIDGVTINDDGTISIDNDTYDLSYLIQQKQINDSISITLFRDRKFLKVSLPLKDKILSDRLVSNNIYDIQPEFYIIGGLIFTTLTKNYIEEWGNKWYQTAPTHFLYEFFYGEKSIDNRSKVVLSKILPDDINIGYHNLGNLLIDRVNGENISGIKDIINKIEKCNSKYYTFESGNTLIVLNRGDCIKNGDKLLKKFNIPKDRNIN